MEQGELIDKMTGEMYAVASDSRYELLQFAAPWGRKETPEYNARKIRFEECMPTFAKDCGVMALGSSYYYFNGKIYEKVSEFAVCQSYNRLMTKLGIASDYPRSVKVRRELFLGTILAYNQLHVRNDVIAFSNRVVDLRDVKDDDFRGTYKFSPKWHVVDYHPYPFIPNARAPLFMRFLDEVLPDKRQRDILQMFLGLGLIQTSEAFDKTVGGPRGTVELCLVLLGSGANGKSVLFNIVCALFGKHHITSLDYETMTADGDEGLRGRAAIRSAVFNWSSDSDPRKFGQKNTAMFKRIVSGEEYQYRLLGKDIMNSDNCPYLIFSLNQLPNISEGTHGFLRRLQFVNFDVTIPKYRQDPNLAYKIIEHDLPGIFNWVLRGAREIRRRHFTFPSSDVSLKTKIRALLPTNNVYAWMLTYGIRPEPLAPAEIATIIPAEQMYSSFQKFCEDNDSEILSQNKFGRRLSAMNFIKLRKSDGMYYEAYGIDEDHLRTPMMLNALHDADEDATLDYENDGKSIIADD